MSKKKQGNKFQLSDYLNWKLYLVLVLIILSLSIYVRYNQYNRWKQHETLYFVQNYPAMTTLDAYYWLRYAKEYKNGTYNKYDNDTLRAYPDTASKPQTVPMISFLIAKFSSISNMDIYRSGLFLVPILASLFIIPAALYFFYCSMPMAGIIGGFVGTFSWMYYLRTSMGRIDTDLLQLFFLFLSSLFLLFIIETKENKRIYIYSGLTGLTLALFGWWYAHTGIILIYMTLLIFILIVNRIKTKIVLSAVLIFIIFANPLYVYSGFYNLFGFLHNYFIIENSTSSGFPNILNTITEAEHMPFSKIITYILSSKTVDIIGLIGFLISIKFLKMRTVPLLPVLGLGIMAFSGANRSIMFLAPFVGFGIGFFIDWLMSYLKERSSKNRLPLPALSITAAVLIIFGLSTVSAINFVPKPSIASDIVTSFIDIKHKINQANIVSWWDYGYAIEDIDSFATYHDGGTQGSAKTYFIAKGFLSDNQTEFHNIISYIDRFGIQSINEAIKEGADIRTIIDNVTHYSKKIEHKDNYLLFTRDMISKFQAISYIGNWDFKAKKSHPFGFNILMCTTFRNNRLKCSGNVFDLNEGLINNKIPIKRVVFSENGNMAMQKNYFDKGVTLELILKGNRLIYAMVCDEKTYRTNFNQIYLLGNYKKDYFQEVYNNFPSARMFRIR